ncbi:MAG: hypothetical protein PHQ23_15025 [Candidatus Wallbacteria bacterium]|nr:hypothetical protein [Candidatus Wallbacteria bacterium]
MTDNSNRALFDFVESKKHIKVNKSDDCFWSAEFRKDCALIRYSDKGNRYAAFAHELLHIKVQLDGLRKVVCGIAIDNKILSNGYLVTVIDALDNELQHHKFFKDFLNMGYSADDFFNDDDFEKGFNTFLVQNEHFLEEILVQYVALLLPVGKAPQLKEKFESKFSNHLVKFGKIDQIFSAWRDNNANDYQKCIVDFFRIFDSGQVWLGYSKSIEDFPEKGFFTSSSFALPLGDPSS